MIPLQGNFNVFGQQRGGFTKANCCYGLFIRHLVKKVSIEQSGEDEIATLIVQRISQMDENVWFLQQ